VRSVYLINMGWWIGGLVGGRIRMVVISALLREYASCWGKAGNTGLAELPVRFVSSRPNHTVLYY